ncbi:MAG: hypothetical protein R2867_43180 [Caldilineaceae bacterium]
MLITTFIVGFFAFLFILATIAPLGSLGWWAGWFGEELSFDELNDANGTSLHRPGDGTPRWSLAPQKQTPSENAVATQQVRGVVERVPLQRKPIKATQYIVYLSGIGAFTGSSIPREELPFVAALRTQLANSIVITDVFPYSVTNMGLTGERLFARIWRYIEAQRPKNPNSLWLYLVVVRNMFQVMVSADRRYGPIYNLGVAREIWWSLYHHGYRPGMQNRITLIGASGGAQIAIGAANYLAKVADLPIQIISLGGVIASDPGLLKISHLYHLYGANDGTHKLGARLFPGRWSITVNSAWNRARQRGLITMKETGPADHVGENSQFDPHAFASDGRSYFQITLDEVLTILQPRSKK